ncbi:MAG: competence type IV pilus major pilin ComGC [Tuberibacillus sp.]
MRVFLSSLKSQKAFTLIEMMIVLMIISILLLIALPNMTQSNQVVKKKSCDATINLIKSQMAAYEAENSEPLTNLKQLEGKYVDRTTCPDGTQIILKDDGSVVPEGS